MGIPLKYGLAFFPQVFVINSPNLEYIDGAVIIITYLFRSVPLHEIIILLSYNH